MIRLPLLLTAACCAVAVARAAPPAEAIPLFNGQDLTGWTAVLSDETVPPEQVWSAADGVLRCTGVPSGYIRTDAEYENYVLTLEWRWPGEAGNNGVLVHTGEPAALGIWPHSIEVQLHHGNAGDFWVIGTELDVENESERVEGRRHRNLTDDSEKPLGEWNRFEITCRGNEVLVKVNGTLVNHGANCSVSRGAISLQSEGAAIEYRDIVLTPLAE